MTLVASSPQRNATMSAPAGGRLLVVDDHAAARSSMCDILRQAGHRVDAVSSVGEALRLAGSESFDVVVTDLQMPGLTGLDLVERLRERRYGAQIIVVTAYASVSTAVEAMRRGAFDYMEKPFPAEQLEALVARALVQAQLKDQKQALSGAREPMAPAMIGGSRAMQEFRARIARVAPTDETVLISGESGTGKELAARAVHAASGRARAELVSLNCPVLSAQLMESELFGHERGAFTGADSPRTGRFELADGGTILLDEITEIDLGLQAKLLRVLQERSFERVGSSRTLGVDVRVLATTNRDLPAEVAAGRFRQDLYFRLAVVPISVPPLRARREDVRELVTHFLKQTAARLHREPATLSAGAFELLESYHWPGNVRELENLITRASVLNDGPPLTADELRAWLLEPEGGEPLCGWTETPVGSSLEEMERRLIEATLERFDGHRAKTAQALGIGIRTLSGKLRAYGYAPRAKRAG